MAQPLLAGQFTGQRRPGLLPIEPNSFIGRTAEAQRLTALLRSARLVTVVGPGGVGKSRLCLHIASAALSAGRFADGVVLVELSTVTDPALTGPYGKQHAVLRAGIPCSPCFKILESYRFPTAPISGRIVLPCKPSPPPKAKSCNIRRNS